MLDAASSDTVAVSLLATGASSVMLATKLTGLLEIPTLSCTVMLIASLVLLPLADCGVEIE